ncbi:MAG: type I-D CRISPR-associated protein Cas5/Csc1 [Candidatus Korarchaeota archaeon]|nr:type I-D CRISPR-associated protein Cas5/Csc1 [Candidatus Korarchaeota archaeon]
MKLKAYLLTITIHDFFFYASHELRVAVTAPFIHNTALGYAVNRFSKIHRVASGPEPSYTSDFSEMTIYVTPASMDGASPVVGDRSIRFPIGERVGITRNAVNTVTQTTESGNLVLPALITYMAYPPLTTFRAYSLGGTPPPVIRIGKKEPPARIRYEELSDINLGRGRFEPTHPVSLIDIPKDTKVIKADIYDMRPSPLLVRSVLDGLYIVGLDRKGRKHVIALPDPKKYPKVSGLVT